MEVGQSSLLDLLAKQDTRFAIPAYQRRYAWQQRQCEELWLDVLRAGRRNERHFSGTVLYEEEPGEKGGRCLSIVDGQQRMTTVMLMLVALRNYLARHPGVLGDMTAEQVDRTFLMAEACGGCGTGRADADAGADAGTDADADAGADTDTDADADAGADTDTDAAGVVPKLRLSRLDAASMAKAVAGAAPDDIPSRNVSCNLAYFESLMQEDGFDPAVFERGLKNLNVVMAQADAEDDAQAVFESLNSKGLKLNIGDMVRNYLLASEDHAEQTRLYIEYWTMIEGAFDPDPGSLKLDTMIKAWLSVRFTKVRARTPEDVYSAFKRYYDDEYAGELEPVLSELRSFAMVWAENYRYHAVKKFRSMPWAKNGAQTLTSGYELKKADNEEYAERVRQELRAMGREQ